MDDVFKPFADAERSAGTSWPSSIEQVRPLAGQALLAVFRRTMDEEVEATLRRARARLALTTT